MHLLIHKPIKSFFDRIYMIFRIYGIFKSLVITLSRARPWDERDAMKE